MSLSSAVADRCSGRRTWSAKSIVTRLQVVCIMCCRYSKQAVHFFVAVKVIDCHGQRRGSKGGRSLSGFILGITINL